MKASKAKVQRRFPAGSAEGMEVARMALLEMLHLGGVSQAQLAVVLGITRPGVTRMLAGESNPTVATLGAVAEACRVRFRIEVLPRRRPR